MLLRPLPPDLSVASTMLSHRYLLRCASAHPGEPGCLCASQMYPWPVMKAHYLQSMQKHGIVIGNNTGVDSCREAAFAMRLQPMQTMQPWLLQSL